MLWRSSNGRIELQLTKAQAALGSHPGPCDDDILYLSKMSRIVKQLQKIDPEDLKGELEEFGAWDEEELSDHEQNLQRILWIACGAINEEASTKGRYR